MEISRDCGVNRGWVGGGVVIKVFGKDDMKGKEIVAGFFDEPTKTFHKNCDVNHFVRIFKGFGIDEEVVKFLQKSSCEKIIINYRGEVGEFNFKDWVNYGLLRNLGNVGWQFFYPWDKS